MFVKTNIKKPFSKLDRVTFREILHYVFQMTDDVMMDRGKHQWLLKWRHFLEVFRAFDVNGVGAISARHWILGMSVFLRGTIEQRAQCKSHFSLKSLFYSQLSSIRFKLGRNDHARRNVSAVEDVTDKSKL